MWHVECPGGECMKKLIAAIKRAPKIATSLAVVAAAVLVPAALFAWGPSDRATFTMQAPAPYVTFNSITDNPIVGDERNFVRIKDAGTDNSAYSENINLQAGKEYDVFVYYHNNASTTLNDEAHNYAGIAKDAFMRVQMPTSVNAGEKARVTGFVGASNSNPGQVWDEAYATASSAFNLKYVAGSAKVYSNGAVNGQTMPDSLATTGAKLGYEALDGKLPGCNQFAGYVVFKFRADQPNFELEKQVGKAGENKYSEEITALPGEEVEYKIKYKNTGTSQQDNVMIKDALPKGLSYVNGSTYISNSKTNNKWDLVKEETITGKGLNIGSYAPGGAAYLKFKAKVTDNTKLEKCGVNKLVNTATAETDNGNKSDTATVVVSKTCDEKPCVPGTDKACTQTPAELPKTGADDSLVAIVGLGSLIAAASYYIASRRTLN